MKLEVRSVPDSLSLDKPARRRWHTPKVILSQVGDSENQTQPTPADGALFSGHS